ncbi:MAG: PepSY domain-containing protein [Stenotrophomonas nitritireducens]|uniref:PepSY-associated TM helix domain-containing protein n=1 Tax=Stenotrophomonas nitritireducens TaxID=83617 RepID=UPI001AC4F750|nr:PepSY domain-containing protein [Stenotrophomonas nitritireducens]MBN8768981.1 PepSY domain-containing protein [Stenotrophomonas sp.]MBN8793019.1 PepSY domain-containing protein [Stenotrophomonas nitritireducens]
MASTTEMATGHDLRRRAWRWHFLAALLVIPFVLWQSVTGTLYLWSETWVDQRHPDLRFVEPGAHRVSLDAQVQAARDYMGGARVGNVLVPSDSQRSTQVMFTDTHGLPMAVFVDPWQGVLLGRLQGVDWPVGWSRSLHGGWPLGDAGSWLLEIGACWTIVMVLTGLYLWWPCDGRGWRALLPRLRSGGWIFWRDLHACMAVWLSLLIVLFLFTALPWTSFWGGRVLGPVQQLLGQQTPAAAGFAPVFAGGGTGGTASLQQMLDTARGRGLHGDLSLLMVEGPPGSAVSLRSNEACASDDRFLLFDRADATVLDETDGSRFPLMAKAVASGVKIHQGDYFGRFGPWINTSFALTLIWLCITGAIAWWRRKPAHALGVPSKPRAPWPWWLRLSALVMFTALPLLMVSAALLWLAETTWIKALFSRRPPKRDMPAP